MIVLDNNYSIDTKGAGCSLIFSEMRIAEKEKDKGNLTEYTDGWYFLEVGQCLEKYLQLSLEPCSDVKECLNKIEEVKQLIKTLKLC